MIVYPCKRLTYDDAQQWEWQLNERREEFQLSTSHIPGIMMAEDRRATLRVNFRLENAEGQHRGPQQRPTQANDSSSPNPNQTARII